MHREKEISMPGSLLFSSPRRAAEKVKISYWFICSVLARGENCLEHCWDKCNSEDSKTQAGRKQSKNIFTTFSAQGGLGGFGSH